MIPLTEFEAEGETIKINLRFQPTQSFVISVSAGKKAMSRSVKRLPTAGQADADVQPVLTLPNKWEFSPDGLNALPLNEWQLVLAAQVAGQDHCSYSPIYQTEFQVAADLSQARLLIDGLLIEKVWRRSRPIAVEIKLNGHPITEFEPGEYLDHYIKEADVTNLLKRGKNILTVKTASALHEAGNLGHPAILVGDFRLRQREGKWVMVPPGERQVSGSWTEFGYPFYSGVATYRQEVRLPRRKSQERLFLHLDSVGDLADIRMNGKPAGVLLWEPFEAEITDLVKAGNNQIEIKVANSLQNLLVMTPKPSGILGQVEIFSRKAR